MPTARELLEQADALMRRNRTQPGRSDEVIHASPMPPPRVSAPAREMQREPVRDALTVSPTVPGVHAEDIELDVPVLTDAVAAEVQAGVEGSSPPQDDIPVLTDAVEEIEAAPPVADEQQGEPSLWREDEAAPSVIGEAANSVMVVPALEQPAEDDEVDRALGLHRAAQPGAHAHGGPPDVSLELTPDPVEIEPVADGSLTLEAIDEAQPPLPTDAEAIDEAQPPLPGAGEASDAGASDAAIAETSGIEDVASDFGPFAAQAQEPVTGSTPAGRDDAQWAALAEEVRMQVLQRIDIFTDTGLREQLGARLKPVVDRASADLIATINQHVGDLLRAYVAEAIEREIVRWREHEQDKAAQ